MFNTRLLQQLRCSSAQRPMLYGCGHWKLGTCRSLASNTESNRNTLRKQIAPLLKLIHPDFFSQHDDKIQQDNMEFLQSLNSLIDNMEQLHASCRKRNMCDISVPLLTSYTYCFHIKLPLSSTDVIPDTRPVRLVLSVPRDLTFRQTASSTLIQKQIAALLHRLGPIFEAVDISNPWILDDSNTNEEKAFPWETNSRRRSPSSPSSPIHGFRKRRAGVSVDDPTIQAIIEERMVERTLSGNLTSIFGGADNSRLMQGEVDKYIRNGNVLTRNLSPVEQLHTMKRVRDFFLKCGHLVNFSFNVWNSVLILIDGLQLKNSFKKEHLKKRILVIIPAKFRSNHLVQYLHKVVPQARLVMPSIDGLKKNEDS